ncbi:MAG: FAD-dependent oxidoreductase [Pirellulales bacterium]
MNTTQRIVIVGGVAGGATAAARCRRLDAHASITILEKGSYISFANCGLPYHVGGEIPDRQKLLVASEKLFWDRFRVHVRCRHEVQQIDREARCVRGIRHDTGEPFEIHYDKLLLSLGSEPNTPPFWQPANNLRHLWTMEDMDQILRVLHETVVHQAIVVGAGFVGLEIAEQLQQRGVKVTLVQQQSQILGPLNLPIARLAERHLIENGIQLCLSRSVNRLQIENGWIQSATLDDGTAIETQLVISCTGVRPRTQLASLAGIELGSSRGVRVDNQMQTNDPHIWAVGDMVEYLHGVTQSPCLMPLAGPANRAGRVAAASMTGPSNRLFNRDDAEEPHEVMGPVLGTAIVRLFDWTVACTGLNLATLRAKEIPPRYAIIQAPQHASYFPDAHPLTLMLCYAPDGKILGAQAIGREGVDKRIDVIATAMHFGGTVHQLAQLDLAYAPPFGSAKDPVHMAAFAACNDLAGRPVLVPADISLADKQVVDVRTSREREQLPLPDSIPIPIDELHDRWQELDPHRETIVVCHSAKRAHIGATLLLSHGFRDVKNLSGGMSIRSLLCG